MMTSAAPGSRQVAHRQRRGDDVRERDVVGAVDIDRRGDRAVDAREQVDLHAAGRGDQDLGALVAVELGGDQLCAKVAPGRAHPGDVRAGVAGGSRRDGPVAEVLASEHRVDPSRDGRADDQIADVVPVQVGARERGAQLIARVLPEEVELHQRGGISEIDRAPQSIAAEHDVDGADGPDQILGVGRAEHQILRAVAVRVAHGDRREVRGRRRC